MRKGNKRKGVEENTPKGRLALVWAAVLSGIAGVAAIIGNITQITKSVEDFWRDPRQVIVGWLVVPSQGDIPCIVTKNARFKLANGKDVGMVTNKCYNALLERSNADYVKAHGETVSKSYFLLVDNIGDRLEQIDVLGANERKVAGMSSLDHASSVAICLGYIGKANNPGRPYNAVSVRLYSERGSTNAKTYRVPPLPDEKEMYGISHGCGVIRYGYPDIETN